MILYIGIGITVLFFLMGTPIYVAFGLGSAFFTLLVFGLPPQVIASYFVGAINNFLFLAAPLFILTGDMFVKSGASKYLINVIKKVVGRLPGGLGLVTIVANAFFAAMAGSTIATIAAMGSIMTPELKSEGYEEGTIAALTAASGGLGIIIPPSFHLILYGVLVEQDVAVLFAAGFVPGLLAAGMLYVALLYILRKEKFIELSQTSNNKESTFDINYTKTIPALMAPVIILGGIYGGIFTPTEAAAVGVVYVMLIGIFIYKELNFKTLQEVLEKSVITVSSLSLVVCGGVLLGKMTTLAGIPQAMTNFVVSQNLGPTGFLLLCAGLLLLLGLFVTEVVIMLVFVPIVYPSVVMLGISPIQFAVFVVIALIIGQCTPPVATNLYTATLICKVPIEKTCRKIIPFVIALIITLLLIAFVPGISLFLPRIMGMTLP